MMLSERIRIQREKRDEVLPINILDNWIPLAAQLETRLAELEDKLDESRLDYEYLKTSAKKHIDNIEAQNAELRETLETTLLHLDASVCECGFELRETDAADTLREAIP